MKKALLALVIAGAMQTGAGLPSRTLIAPNPQRRAWIIKKASLKRCLHQFLVKYYKEPFISLYIHNHLNII